MAKSANKKIQNIKSKNYTWYCIFKQNFGKDKIACIVSQVSSGELPDVFVQQQI